ncbi:MAG: hypothetical protein QNJ98_01425 [Planctomycetota bacterium]|nr:hypothetical protein [Planctomycetota bacterium]
MKRLPAFVWILLPVLVGLVYAVVAPLFEREPAHASMAPPGAVLVERFKDLDTFDRDYYFALGKGAPTHSAVLGVENNVARLPGVDRGRPLYLIKMPPSSVGTDATVTVFPVADRDAFEQAFLDPEMLEKGLIRRAKHLQGHGSWAAVGARRGAIRQVGEGTLSAAERGEDFSIAAFLPGLAVTAVQNRQNAPWRSVLAALVDEDASGDDPAVEVRRNQATGELIPVFTGAPRLARILETWRIARLWSWRGEKRVEVELVPTSADVVPWLSAAAADTTNDTRIPAPPTLREARMWLRVPNAKARVALLALVHTLGVEVPADLREGMHAGGLLVLATRAAGHPYAASYAVVSPREAPLDLSPLLGTVPEPGARAERATGTLPLTVIDVGSDRPSPEGVIAHEVFEGLDVVGVGVSAPTAVTRVRELLARSTTPAWERLGQDDWTTIARFALDAGRAAKLLGSTVEERGLFGALHGGFVRGEIRTDGKAVRITLQGGS